MTNDEISNLAVNALMDRIAQLVAKGKSKKGLTEDEHAIAMAHVVVEVRSLLKPEDNEQRVLAVAIRAVKNASQMRQVAEKRGILDKSEKGDKVNDIFSQYT